MLSYIILFSSLRKILHSFQKSKVVTYFYTMIYFLWNGILRNRGVSPAYVQKQDLVPH